MLHLRHLVFILGIKVMVSIKQPVNVINRMVGKYDLYRCWNFWQSTMRWRIYAFELWYWRRLLRIPWRARRSNQSVLKEINPEYSLEGVTLKMKLQYFGHLMKRTHSFSNAKKDWGQEEKGVTEAEMVGWHQWCNGHEFEQASGDSEGQGSLACCSPRGHKESDVTEQLSLFSYERFISIILLPTYLLHFFPVTFSLFILVLELFFIVPIVLYLYN